MSLSIWTIFIILILSVLYQYNQYERYHIVNIMTTDISLTRHWSTQKLIFLCSNNTIYYNVIYLFTAASAISSPSKSSHSKSTLAIVVIFHMWHARLLFSNIDPQHLYKILIAYYNSHAKNGGLCFLSGIVATIPHFDDVPLRLSRLRPSSISTSSSSPSRRFFVAVVDDDEVEIES